MIESPIAGGQLQHSIGHALCVDISIVGVVMVLQDDSEVLIPA